MARISLTIRSTGVTSEQKLIKEVTFRKDLISIKVGNQSAEQFLVSLQSNREVPKSLYLRPEKPIAKSDIAGNYNAFTNFLIQHNIMDKNHNLTFNKRHLVLFGGAVDWSKDVKQVLWLIYKLEQQAQANNGKVHFILGNHEVLNSHRDYRYDRRKYIKVAQRTSGPKD